MGQYRDSIGDGVSITLLLPADALGTLAELVAPLLAPSHDRWITVAEAAEYLGTSRHRVYRLLHGDSGIPHVREGRRILFRRRDLDRWLKEQAR